MEGKESLGHRPERTRRSRPGVRQRVAGMARALVLIFLAFPLGAEAQTTCTTSSVAVTGAVTGTPDVAGLVADCTTLLGLKDTLRGTATLNWAENLTAKQVRSAKNWCHADLPEDLQYLIE